MKKSSIRDSLLVIDDNLDLRNLIEAIAETSGVRVLQAGDCHAGLKIVEREHARLKLILLDYLIPGMDPKKCAEAVVAKAGSDIPVVLITAACDAPARAAELKLNRWLAKPFDLESITELLAAACLVVSFF